MPICKCGKVFTAKIIIDNKVVRIRNRKTCFECLPYSPKPQISVTNTDCICDACGRSYKYKRHRSSHNKCGHCRDNARSKNCKLRAIEYKGGSCILCGYNRCVRALVFHHIDPKNKLFDISGRHCLSWGKIKPELDKCVLLCCRCHMEVEAGLTELPDVS